MHHVLNEKRLTRLTRPVWALRSHHSIGPFGERPCILTYELPTPETQSYSLSRSWIARLKKIAQCEPSLRLTPDLDFCREPLPLRVHVPVFQLWCQPIKKKEKCWYFSLPGPYSLLWPVNFWGFFWGGKTNSGSLTFRTIFQRGGNPTSDPKGARVDFVFQ